VGFEVGVGFGGDFVIGVLQVRGCSHLDFQSRGGGVGVRGVSAEVGLIEQRTVQGETES
jgi:hypothetical protein